MKWSTPIFVQKGQRFAIQYLRDVHIADITVSDKDSANLIRSHTVGQVANKQGSGGTSITTGISSSAAITVTTVSGVTATISSTITASISATVTSVPAVASGSSTVSHLCKLFVGRKHGQDSKKTGNPQTNGYTFMRTYYPMLKAFMLNNMVHA
jgi:hypothetical protein